MAPSIAPLLNPSTQSGDAHTSDHIADSPSSPVPLQITIVGAGIGGISAAIFLRHQGHHITLLEQSRFANEIGAAVHLSPNANGLLKRMGLYAEATGANPARRITEFLADGREASSVDLTHTDKMWMHQWLMAHRAHLHSELKRIATMQEGKGRPVQLFTGSRVVDVDPDTATVTLESGEQLSADVVLGADGVHSRTRAKIPGAEGIKPFGSGKSAFRFLVPRERALADEETRIFAERDGNLILVLGSDRRVVIYPTSNNTLLNFVCIHPTTESEIDGNREKDKTWNRTANKQNLLEVYRNFSPGLIKLLDMVDEEAVNVWELLDMDNLPVWCVGRLGLLGDAAHPFTPYVGQGAGQAIEDAASLAVVLPLGTPVDEISDRLKLYEKCRYERACRVQEYSRIAGRDLGDGPALDARKYTSYNFGHDEWHHSTHALRSYLSSKTPNLYIRNPISFGPMPGPRQDHLGKPRNNSLTNFMTTSVRFRTSRTLLQNMLPGEGWRFTSPATVAEASWKITTLSNVEWLGGKGYTHYGLYIHGIQYKTDNGDVIKGTFLPVLFENLADPIVSGREELGMPKLWCELDVENEVEKGGDWRVAAAWLGERFCDLRIQGLEEVSVEQEDTRRLPANETGLLWYKCIPSTAALTFSSSKNSGIHREMDAAYAVFLPDHSEESLEEKVERTWIGKNSTVTWNSLDWKRLPTLHHVVERLEEIPVLDVVECKFTVGRGGSDVQGARRV